MDPLLIRKELARLLEDPLFARAKVLREIMVFLVESAMARRPTDELALAAQVFGIPAEEFHPYKKSNVRVQLRNLRLKLDAYYLARTDVQIKFRLVGYEVVFERTEDSSSSARRALNDARQLIDSRFPEDLIHANRLVEEILRTHPRWSAAWEMRSNLLISMAVNGAGLPRHLLETAGDCADRALEAAPSSGLAHAAKASVEAFLHWNWKQAEQLYGRGISLDPSVRFDSWYHAFLVSTGKRDEALKLLEEGLCVLDRPISSFQTNLGVVQFLCRRFDMAEVELQRAHKINPDDWSSLAWLAVLQWHCGHHIRAAYTQAKAMAAARRSPPQQYFEFANEGILGGPRVIGLAEDSHGGVSEIGVMVASAVLHYWSRAIDALERMYESRYPLAHFFPQVPLFDPLWRIPRFRDLFSQVGLPEPEHAARAKSA